MNDIIKPLSKDGLVGWDQYGQLWLWRVDGERRCGTTISDVRQKTCCVCRRGWEETAQSLGDQHYWQNRAEWAHESCFIRFRALQEYEFWEEALVAGGFIFGWNDDPWTMKEQKASLKAIPNEYWGSKDPWGAWRPWYRVRILKKLQDGKNVPHGRTLKLGSRKRVYHMEIEPGEGFYDEAAAHRLFDGEDVTKEIGRDGMMIHAWGDTKAQEYLKHFATILGASRKAVVETATAAK